MITLVVEARRIPDGTTVRKVTGQSKYVLKREITIHMPDDKRKITTEGMVFLMGESSINGYPESQKFAVDLPDDEARDFLDRMLEAEETHP